MKTGDRIILKSTNSLYYPVLPGLTSSVRPKGYILDIGVLMDRIRYKVQFIDLRATGMIIDNLECWCSDADIELDKQYYRNENLEIILQ